VDIFEHGMSEITVVLDQKFATLRKDLDESLLALSQQFGMVQETSMMLQSEVNKADTAIATNTQALDRLTRQVQLQIEEKMAKARSETAALAHTLSATISQLTDRFLNELKDTALTTTISIMNRVEPRLQQLELARCIEGDDATEDEGWSIKRWRRDSTSQRRNTAAAWGERQDKEGGGMFSCCKSSGEDSGSGTRSGVGVGVFPRAPPPPPKTNRFETAL